MPHWRPKVFRRCWTIRWMGHICRQFVGTLAKPREKLRPLPELRCEKLKNGYNFLHVFLSDFTWRNLLQQQQDNKTTTTNSRCLLGSLLSLDRRPPQASVQRWLLRRSLQRMERKVGCPDQPKVPTIRRNFMMFKVIESWLIWNCFGHDSLATKMQHQALKISPIKVIVFL